MTEEVTPLDHWLQRKLHRWDCPSSDQLADFTMMLLSDDDTRSVAAHVASCPRCQQEIDEAAQFLSSDDAPNDLHTSNPTHHTRRLFEIFPAPVSRDDIPFAARGLQSDGILMLSTNNASVFLELRDENGKRFLEGRLAVNDPDEWTDALVELTQQGVLQTVSVVDAMGGFACHLPDNEPFDLRLTSLKGTSIVLEQIT